MKVKSIIAALLLMVAGLQAAVAQGFRVYKKDGTFTQYSFRADKIVFYDGAGEDVDFGPFTPVNQMIVGTWHKTVSETVTFNEDGTTDYMEGATYKFLPYQGTIIIYNASGASTNILKVHDITADQMILSTLGSNLYNVLSRESISLCPDNHHPHAIDLGLPSGTKWSCCNVGAYAPESHGGYYAWGETSEKSEYSKYTYEYYEGGYSPQCTDIGADIAGTKYDVAHVRMGYPWCMPTSSQAYELYSKCSKQVMQYNGVDGILMIGPSGNQIFIPNAGRYQGEEFYENDRNYWTSSKGSSSSYAYSTVFSSQATQTYRWNGYSVRAVCQ